MDLSGSNVLRTRIFMFPFCSQAEPFLRAAKRISPQNDRILTNLAACIKFGDKKIGKAVSVGVAGPELAHCWQLRF